MNRRFAAGGHIVLGALLFVLAVLLLLTEPGVAAGGLDPRGVIAHGARCCASIEMTPTAEANKGAAIRDAKVLLGRVVLPAGARRSSREPAGADGRLGHAWTSPATPTLVERHRWWTVPGEPRAVLSSIEAHPPVGSRRGLKGTSSGPRGITWVVGYEWPEVTGVLGSRQLIVQLVTLPRGRTGIRADAQNVWVVPKPAADAIPATAKVLDLTVTRPEAGPQRPAETLLSTTVTEAAKVSAIVGAINRMSLLQPGVVNCPEIPFDGPIATFTFLSSTEGPVVATAGMPAYTKSENTSCYPLTLTLPTLDRTVTLAEGEIVGLAEQVLGVSVYTPE